MSAALPLLTVLGAAGAFMYAGPKLIVCRRSFLACGKPDLCGIEFVVAITIGAIAAMAYTDWAGQYLSKAVFFDVKAFAVTIGLVANRAAPWVVKETMKRLGKVPAEEKDPPQ